MSVRIGHRHRKMGVNNALMEGDPCDKGASLAVRKCGGRATRAVFRPRFDYFSSAVSKACAFFSAGVLGGLRSGYTLLRETLCGTRLCGKVQLQVAVPD